MLGFRFRRHIAFSLLGLGLSLASPPAHAQDPAAENSAEALKRAREQFGQALALQTAGDWAGALTLLKEVAAVKSTPQVRFNMALCEEKLGKLVAALGDYELAAADARAEKADQVAEEVPEIEAKAVRPWRHVDDGQPVWRLGDDSRPGTEQRQLGEAGDVLRQDGGCHGLTGHRRTVVEGSLLEGATEPQRAVAKLRDLLGEAEPQAEVLDGMAG